MVVVVLPATSPATEAKSARRAAVNAPQDKSTAADFAVLHSQISSIVVLATKPALTPRSVPMELVP